MPRVCHDCVASCVSLVCLCARPTAYRPCSPASSPYSLTLFSLIGRIFSRATPTIDFLLPPSNSTISPNFRKRTISFFHSIGWNLLCTYSVCSMSVTLNVMNDRNSQTKKKKAGKGRTFRGGNEKVSGIWNFELRRHGLF